MEITKLLDALSNPRKRVAATVEPSMVIPKEVLERVRREYNTQIKSSQHHQLNEHPAAIAVPPKEQLAALIRNLRYTQTRTETLLMQEHDRISAQIEQAETDLLALQITKSSNLLIKGIHKRLCDLRKVRMQHVDKMYVDLEMMRADQQAQLSDLHACFSVSVRHVDLGNQVWFLSSFPESYAVDGVI